MSRRGWVLFLCGCLGIFCLEAPNTLDWMLTTVPDRTVQAAFPSARLVPAQAGLFSFSLTAPQGRATSPATIRADQPPVNFLGGLNPFSFTSPFASSSQAVPAPAVSTPAKAVWQVGAGCMPVPRVAGDELP